MEKRALAGRMVHPVGLGCMNLSWAYGDPPPHADKLRLLERALELGYDHLDTANIYGLGRNEELLGEAVIGPARRFPARQQDRHRGARRRRARDRLRPAGDDRSRSTPASRGCGPITSTCSTCTASIRKVPIADMVGALARAIEAGKIGAYGVSEWSAAHIREAHAVHPMAAVQTEYSLWTRQPEIAVLETTRELGIAFVAFSPGRARGVRRGAGRNADVRGARHPRDDAALRCRALAA